MAFWCDLHVKPGSFTTMVSRRLATGLVSLLCAVLLAVWVWQYTTRAPNRVRQPGSGWLDCSKSYPGLILPACLNSTAIREGCKACRQSYRSLFYQKVTAYALNAVNKSMLIPRQQDLHELLALRDALQMVEDEEVSKRHSWVHSSQATVYLVDRYDGILVGWTPRAGCSGVVKSLFQHMDVDEQSKSLHPWVHDYRQQEFREAYGNVQFSELLNADPRRPLLRLKFVRNPYYRAVSSYEHFILSLENNDGRGYKNLMRRFNVNAFRGVALRKLSFRQFLNGMSEIQDGWQDLYTGVDTHVAPQVTALEAALANIGVPMFDAIFQIDQFNFSLMPQVLKRNYTYTRYAPHKLKRREEVDVAKWPTLPYRRAVKMLPSDYLDIFRAPHGTELERLVYKIYCLDFTLGGYQRIT